MAEALNNLRVVATVPDGYGDTVRGKSVAWINLERPTREQLRLLGEQFHFHPLDLDDCLSRIQLPKVDEYPDYIFVILHFPVFNKRTRITSSSQVAIFLGRDFVVTVHPGDLKPLAKLFQSCAEAEAAAGHEYLSKDSGYLFYRIVDLLVDYCFPMLAKTLDRLDLLEDKVFDELVGATREAATLRRDIAAQRRITWPLKAVVSDLERRAQRFTEMDLAVYFGDIGDHLNRVWNTLEEAKETIEIFKDSDFILNQDRMQRIMTVLTIIAATMAPLTVISSIYGMNVPLPGSGAPGHPAVGWVLMAIMASIAGGLLYFFRRHRWF